MVIKRSELFKSLWKRCDDLRGRMDITEYRGYVLALLFVRYVSDKQSGQLDTLIEVPKGGGFADIVALKDDRDIGDKINRIISRLAEANDLKGVIDRVDFNDSSKLGYGKQMQNRLSDLITILEDPRLNFSHMESENDGFDKNAFEYLIDKFAEGTGKKGDGFYTPVEVSRLLAKLLAPQPGERICDPVCGSGSLLIMCAKEVENGNYYLWGQESNNSTWALAIMNMLLHNINLAPSTIRCDDTLRNPLTEMGQLMRFNVVAASPPFSLNKWDADRAEYDYFNRFRRGIPPTNRSDYAFLSHIVETIDPRPGQDGRAGVIVPLGVLFREGVEGAIRRKLIEENLIDAVIGLPSNLFYGTGIPAAILIFKRHRPDKYVLFIDASHEFEPNTNQNRLREQDIEKILDAYRTRQNISDYAYLADYDEIAENDFSLTVQRYIFGYQTLEEKIFTSEWSGPHDLFISYSRKDIIARNQIQEALVNAGLRVWTDENLDPGTSHWQTEIEKAIEHSCCGLVLLSPDSKSSDWVKQEITYTRIHGKRIFPVLIQGDEKSSIPILLCSDQYTDLRTDRRQIDLLIDTLKSHVGIRESRSPFLYELWQKNQTRNWQATHLGDLVEFVRPTRTINDKKNLHEEGNYPIYGPFDVIGYSNNYDLEGEYLLIAARNPAQGERNRQAIRFVKDKFCVGKNIHVMRPQPDVSLEFVKYHLWVTDFGQYLANTAQGHLNLSTLKK